MTHIRAPLSVEEKEQLYRGTLLQQTEPELADALRCSLACVHKWKRRIHREGLTGLRVRLRGRPVQGLLSAFTESVRAAARTLKTQHARWGARRVRVALAKDPALRGMKLPSASRLAAYFRQVCPEQVTVYQRHAKRLHPEAPARTVHEVWQLDHQENIRLGDGEIATITNIRDPLGAALIASQAFAVRTGAHYRKLTWTEVRSTLRHAFTEWHTLPAVVQTDNELSMAGQPTDAFPSGLTLWLVGLGITHRFIHRGRPTEQGQVERSHRTLDGFALDETTCANLTSLQAALDRERHLYNDAFPSRASQCAGQPPRQAYPALDQPYRPYTPQAEADLFEIRRVYAFLATLKLERRVTSSGQVRLAKKLYWIGRRFAQQTVQVAFDAERVQWVFRVKPATGLDLEIKRCAPTGLDFQSLAGTIPDAGKETLPLQLSFPCFAN